MDTNVQAVALRAQFARIIASADDREVIEFWTAAGEELAEVLTEKELERLEAKANGAQARFNSARAEAAKEAVEKTAKSAPRVFTEEQTRANAARIIAGYDGYEAVAEAMGTELERADGKTLYWVGHTIAEAMKDVRETDGKWIFHSWVRDAMRNVRDLAFSLANKRAEASALYFLAPLLAAWKMLTGERISSEDIKEAELLAKKVKPADEWAPWAKKALERLISQGYWEIDEVLVGDLAREVNDAHYRASAFIDGLLGRIPGAIELHRQRIAREKAEKESARRNRQLERAQLCRSMRGNNPGVEKRGKRKKR